MSEHLEAAAAAMGIPEDLVRRSAEARAAADGVSADDLLAAWAGGAPAPAAAAPPSAPPPAEEPAAPEADVVPVDAPAPAATAPAPGPAAVATATAPSAPSRVSRAQALDYDAVVTVPTAGLAESTTSGAPRWLSLLFVVVPLIGLTYIVTFANGPNCGVGGQLAVDRLTGEVENCDGTEFLAAGAAGGVNIRAIVGEGDALYGPVPGNCTSCHGASGQGGTGPALSGGAVLATFAACPDHLEWVRLGTEGFQSAGLTTYGDQAKSVGGGGTMPGFASLTPEQLVAVILYERVVLGGQDADEAAIDCGLVEPETPKTPETPEADPTALDE